jgi:hypothetical protein
MREYDPTKSYDLIIYIDRDLLISVIWQIEMNT